MKKWISLAGLSGCLEVGEGERFSEEVLIGLLFRSGGFCFHPFYACARGGGTWPLLRPTGAEDLQDAVNRTVAARCFRPCSPAAERSAVSVGEAAASWSAAFCFRTPSSVLSARSAR